MNRPRTPTLAIPALAAAFGCLALAGTAGAKVSCDADDYGGDAVPLPGLPRSPEPNVTYEVAIELQETAAVNPRPLLMALRCEPSAEPRFSDAGSAEFPGAAGPGPATRFEVRFPRSGRWRVASMDVSGQFRDHGFYAVRPAVSGLTNTEGVDGASRVPLALAGAAGITGVAAMAFAIRRRRNSRAG
jgi:hypothetical protein